MKAKVWIKFFFIKQVFLFFYPFASFSLKKISCYLMLRTYLSFFVVFSNYVFHFSFFCLIRECLKVKATQFTLKINIFRTPLPGKVNIVSFIMTTHCFLSLSCLIVLTTVYSFNKSINITY